MASLLFGSNISHYIRVDYHGPLHRRNGLQIPSFPKRFAGELTLFVFCCCFFCPYGKKIFYCLLLLNWFV